MRTTPRGTPATLLQPGRFDGRVWMGASPIFLSGPVDLLPVSCDIGADWVAFDPRRISLFRCAPSRSTRIFAAEAQEAKLHVHVHVDFQQTASTRTHMKLISCRRLQDTPREFTSEARVPITT